MSLTKHFQPETLSGIPVRMHLQTLHELHRTRGKVKERKAQLWQLCYKALCSNPTVPVVVAPSYSLACATSTPKDLPFLSKNGFHRPTRRKRLGEEFKTYNLVDVNSGLWYGVPIFTFWREQVDRGFNGRTQYGT